MNHLRTYLKQVGLTRSIKSQGRNFCSSTRRHYGESTTNADVLLAIRKLPPTQRYSYGETASNSHELLAALRREDPDAINFIKVIEDQEDEEVGFHMNGYDGNYELACWLEDNQYPIAYMKLNGAYF